MGLLTDYLKYKYPTTFGQTGSTAPTQGSGKFAPVNGTAPMPTLVPITPQSVPARDEQMAGYMQDSGMGQEALEQIYDVQSPNKPSVWKQVGNSFITKIPLWKRFAATRKMGE